MITLSQLGVPQRDIATLTGRPLSTVNRILRAFRNEGRIETQPRGCKPKATTENQDLAIVAAAAVNPRLTAREIRDELSLPVSVNTLRKRLLLFRSPCSL